MGGVDMVLKQGFVNAQKDTSVGGATVTPGELSGVIAGMRSRGVSDALISEAITKLPGEMQGEYRKVFTPKTSAPATVGQAVKVGADAVTRQAVEQKLADAKAAKSQGTADFDKWKAAETSHYAENGTWDRPTAKGKESGKGALLNAELFYAGKKYEARQKIEKADQDIKALEAELAKLPK